MEVIYQVRDYHYRSDRWDEYVVWTEEATRILREEFDIVGFWFDAGIPMQTGGSSPVDHPLGPSNGTWVIRWESMEERESGWARMWENREWVNHWDAHPDSDGYLNMSFRFMVGSNNA